MSARLRVWTGGGGGGGRWRLHEFGVQGSVGVRHADVAGRGAASPLGASGEDSRRSAYAFVHTAVGEAGRGGLGRRRGGRGGRRVSSVSMPRQMVVDVMSSDVATYQR